MEGRMNQIFAALLFAAAILSFVAPESGYPLGDARIITAILMVGGAIIWCMPQQRQH
jgi:hypothetical protein